MLLGGAWRLPEAYQVDFNWDTVQMPKNPTTGRSRAILHAASYVASARTKNPDLAANLILYLASDEGQMFFATAGGVAPGNPSPEVQDVWIKSFDSLGSPKNIQAFVDATQDSQGVTIFDEIWNYFDTEFATNIFDLGMSVDDAVAQGCEVVQPYLAQQ
jgi:maltose-binding protein MalE